MAAKHRQGSSTTGPQARRRWRVPALLLVSALVGTGITFGVAAPTASAADRSATLTATGVVSGTYPTGGNTVWVSPGSTLTLDSKLLKVNLSKSILGDLGGALGNLLGGLVGLQAKVDLSSVGKGSVTLGTKASSSVTTKSLKKGVYPFTWTFSAVTSGVLGDKTVSLKGNQLSGLGLKLNAKNQYFGYIVSDTKSPCSGASCVSIQTPKLSVAPSVPVVGQLPTVTVPGTTVNVPVPSVPGVNAPAPGQSSSTAPTTGTTAPGTGTTAPGSTKSSTTTNPYGYDAPDCTGPCAVVPKGGGGGGQVGGASDVTFGDLGDAASGSGSNANNGGGSTDAAAAAIAAGGNPGGSGSDQIAVDRAFADAGTGGSSVPGLPTSLTIAAVAALAGASVLWFARRRLARG